MTPHRVVGRALAAVVAVAASATFAAGPAAAAKRATVTLAPGEAITVKYPALIGSNYQQARVPPACDSKTQCDTIPIRFSLPDDVLASGEYQLITEVHWEARAGAMVPAVGKANDNQLFANLYKDPPDKTPAGTNTHSARNSTGGPPHVLSLFMPPPAVNLVVENFIGVNQGYTVNYLLQDLSGGPGSDLSADEAGATFDASDDSGVAVTPTFVDDGSGFLTLESGGATGGSTGGAGDGFAASFGGPAFTLDVLGLRGDPALDSLEGITNPAFRLGNAERIQAASSGPPAPQAAPAAVLLFWFLVAPLVTAGSLVAYIARRRALIWEIT